MYDHMIDAHQHFWRITRNDYGWLTPALGTIYRDFMPADLSPLLQANAITQTILVQAAPTVAETRFLLEIARLTPFVAGVVGWIDFEARDAAAQIEHLARDRKLVGLRPMVQDIEDDDWLLRPALTNAFNALIDHDLVFDALVLPRHLGRLCRLLDRHPRLRVVVDHAGKPHIVERMRGLDPWRAELTAVAACPSTFCKLSGLITEAGVGWQVTDLQPYVDWLLNSFGSNRVLWGSDWPVVELAGGYSRWCAATATLLNHVAPEEREAIRGQTARAVYGLDRRLKSNHREED